MDEHKSRFTVSRTYARLRGQCIKGSDKEEFIEECSSGISELWISKRWKEELRTEPNAISNL
jgi:hypothetical protein